MKNKYLQGAKAISSLIILATVLVACVAKYVPVRTDKISVSENYAVLKTEDYTLAVSYKFWVNEPQNLTDYFLGLHIILRNKTTEYFTVSQQDFQLLDADGMQYDIVLPDNIPKLLIPQESMFDPLTSDESIMNDFKYAAEQRLAARRNLMSESFHFGKILPAAKKSGYIFFPKLNSDNKKFKLVYKNEVIEFVKEK